MFPTCTRCYSLGRARTLEKGTAQTKALLKARRGPDQREESARGVGANFSFFGERAPRGDALRGAFGRKPPRTLGTEAERTPSSASTARVPPPLGPPHGRPQAPAQTRPAPHLRGLRRRPEGGALMPCAHSRAQEEEVRLPSWQGLSQGKANDCLLQPLPDSFSPLLKCSSFALQGPAWGCRDCRFQTAVLC